MHNTIPTVGILLLALTLERRLGQFVHIRGLNRSVLWEIRWNITPVVESKALIEVHTQKMKFLDEKSTPLNAVFSAAKLDA